MDLLSDSALLRDLDRLLLQQQPLVAAGLFRPLSIQPLHWPAQQAAAVAVDLLRADQLHGVISGNKWFKLKYYLAWALKYQQSALVSVGGAWSNHLHALAYSCQLLGLQSKGIVRGDELSADANAMLAEAARWEMALEFVPRSSYRAKCDLLARHEPTMKAGAELLIPEGGDSVLGVMGAASLVQQIPAELSQYQAVLVAAGTGCTFAGLRLALPKQLKLIGVSALKGSWQQAQMKGRLRAYSQARVVGKGVTAADQVFGPWVFSDDFSGRGFAKLSPELVAFNQQFQQATQVELDAIYGVKLMYGLDTMLRSGQFAPGSKLLVIHSGGLQGNRAECPSAPGALK